MFCMLLRKYLCGGRITAVETYGCERLLCFTVQATNELGDRVALKLVCELMGHSANLILVGAEGKIIECARHSDLEKGGRLLQPGARYEPKRPAAAKRRFAAGCGCFTPALPRACPALQRARKPRHRRFTKNN